GRDLLRRRQLAGLREPPAPAQEGDRRLDRERGDGDVERHLHDEERVRKVEAHALGVVEEPKQSRRQRQQRRREKEDVEARKQPRSALRTRRATRSGGSGESSSSTVSAPSISPWTVSSRTEPVTR